MLDSLLQKIRSDSFAALRGAVVTGRLPVREPILNQILTLVRQERDLPTKRLEIRLQDGNQFTVFLQPQIGFLWPQVKLDFEIIPEVNFQTDGRLTLRSLGFLGGPTAQLLRTVLLRALKLPNECVIVEGNLIHIAVREALNVRGATDIAVLFRSLQLATRSGVLYIAFHLSV
jgi:hypothetical protein